MKKDYKEPQFELYDITTNCFLSTSLDDFKDNTVPSIPPPNEGPNGIF